MAKIYQRWDGRNQWYFVTPAIKRREPFFKSEKHCELFQKTFKEVRKHHQFRMAGLAILPDHWHAMICPMPPVVVETVVGAVKLRFLNRIWQDGKRHSIWQSRFLDRRIRNEEDFWFHMEYLRTNAVKHGYVSKPEDYPWIFIHKNPFRK